MKHTPLLSVIDEADGPGMLIRTGCVDCDVILTEHAIDASQIEPARAGDFGASLGDQDAQVWLDHCGGGKR